MEVWVQVLVSALRRDRCGPVMGPARWARRSQSPLGAGEAGVVPIRMERANICLSQKNPD